MKNDYVYTAGAMEHVDYKDMSDWRLYVQEYLSDFCIDCLHPTRRAAIHLTLEENEHISTYNKLKRIEAQDMLDIKQSRVILADLRDSSPGRKWGTVMEVAKAREWDKIVIVVVDPAQFKHPFIYTYATEVHYDLQEALEAVVGYYNDGS
jgi:predicted nucleotidyltransferase